MASIPYRFAPAPPLLPRLRRPRAQTLVLLAVLLVNCVVAREGLLSDAAVALYTSRYGAEAATRLHDWERLLLAHRDSREREKLRRVNDFFNTVPWLTDDEHWGKRDYWATPLEMLGTFGGDCEDYSIAKYVSLVKMGVDPKKLRITYVRARQLRQPHMVLAYYPRPAAEPLILDNLDGVIRPASERRDLIPVYSFNASGLWATLAGKPEKRMGGASKLTGWRDVSKRMKAEGVDTSG